MNNLKNMTSRINNRGGSVQQDRMIKDKKRSLDYAVKHSYQGAKVQLVNSEEIASALINPNKVLADYDEKTISIGYEHNFQVGSVFRWINPSLQNGNTYWLVYLQDLTELAYFKADIRKCEHSISWLDQQGNKKEIFVSVIGPKQKIINTIHKSSFSMDIPNYTITILMPKTEDTLKTFQRYSRFYLQKLNDNNTPICWRVEAVDAITLPNILTIHAKEYVSNDDKDDLENGIVNGLIKPEISQEQINEENENIVGDVFIKPKFTYVYTYIGDDNSVWEYDKTLPVLIKNMGKQIELTWTASYSGKILLKYGNDEKTIVVESLF